MRLKTDWPLFLTILFMVSFGLVFVFSASSVVGPRRYGGEPYYFFVRQAAAAIVSFCALMALSKWDYRKLKTPRWAFTCLGLVLMLLVVVYPQRWIRLGWVSIQPSEFAKPALIIFLAYFVTLRAKDINGRHTLLPVAMAMSVLAGAVVKADLGTGLVLIVTAGAVFYV
ncbi:MAG: FtsW/RodA/SpoVE family cell cycle protein, partial [bacterium]|nr:FtsW/RodA/SpoVE family cell cycle protein [bacterium]